MGLVSLGSNGNSNIIITLKLPTRNLPSPDGHGLLDEVVGVLGQRGGHALAL